MAGHYEVRDETRLGVEVAVIYWLAPGEPATLLTVLARGALPRLAEALARYVGRDPAGGNPASRDAG
jgi:hypothetical protein